MQTTWIVLIAATAILAGVPMCTFAESEQAGMQVSDVVQPASLAGVWQSIQTNQALLHNIISSGNLDEVKAVAFEIRDLAQSLSHYADEFSADSVSKLQAGLAGIDVCAARLDQYSSTGEKTGCEIEAHELDILLASIAALYSAPDSAATIEYSCPMHPEVTSDKPGKCPICKMALIQEDAKE